MIKDIAEVIKKHNLGVCINENDGKLIIEPMQVEEDLPIDTPVMISYDKIDWWLRYYAGDGKAWRFGKKSNADYGATNWDYIIPFDKFDPNNIEESLKHNIVRNK